jgi:Protein of unknown function (DUF2868)
MNEAAAREVLLVQAFEADAADNALWTAEDRAWASRVASENAADAPAQRFIAERAHHALQRLAPREPAVRASLARRLWRRRWIAVVVLAALLLGAVADHIGSAQRINLLAPPVWAVLAWNFVAYLLLIGRAVVAAATRRQPRAGPLMRAMRAALGTGAATASKASPARAALRAFDAAWLRHALPLSSARAALLLHTGAAAFALGLIAGLYARGLVLDYRAGWESTFLDATTVHALLAALLAPAAALSGISVPDADAIAALRFEPGSTAGARAAPWIHLFAITLALAVVLPRAALALASGLRSVWRFPLALGDAYFQRLLRERSGEAARVVVLPYAHTLGAQAALGLRALFASQLGDAVQIEFMPTIAFGGEDDAVLPLEDGALVLLFDLAATPEPEHHGRILSRAKAASGTSALLALVDEAGFVRRFGGTPERIAQRRAAWQRLTTDVVALFVDLEAPDVPAVQSALRTALQRP